MVASPGQMSQEELRKLIERDPQLKKDFDFLIAKAGLTPRKPLTGLRFDCNLMKANRQTLLSNGKRDMANQPRYAEEKYQEIFVGPLVQLFSFMLTTLLLARGGYYIRVAM
jgi:hypothetical protein